MVEAGMESDSEWIWKERICWYVVTGGKTKDYASVLLQGGSFFIT